MIRKRETVCAKHAYDFSCCLSSIAPLLPSNIQPFRNRGFAFPDALIQRDVAGIVQKTVFVALFPEMIPNPFLGMQDSLLAGLLDFFETDKFHFMKVIHVNPGSKERGDCLPDRSWKVF